MKYINNLEINSIYDFDNAFSINELLCKFWEKIEETINISNESIDLLNWLKEEGAPTEIEKIITELVEDGTIERMINVDKIEKLRTTIEEIQVTNSNKLLEITNKITDIDKQLDTNTSDISNVDNKVSVNTSNIVTNTNNINKITSQINSMTNGIKGVYETLDLLKKAYPTGNRSLYVVSSDNYWYYWNGIEWTKGGIFQSLALADNSIDYNKLELCNTDVKCTHFGDFPNYDSTTKTLTFNSSCRVYWGNVGAYEIPSGTTVINAVGGPWVKLVFNTEDKSLRFVDDWVIVANKEIVILTMSRSLKNSYGMDITIDGSYKKPIIIPAETEKQYFQTLEYAKLQNGLLDKNPVLDIKNKTLYFHKTLYDTGFIAYGQIISNVISKNGLLFKFNNSLSGTLKYLLLNTVTKEIVETNTLNGYYAPTYCILLSFTMTTGSDGYINKFVSDGAFEVEVLGYT